MMNKLESPLRDLVYNWVGGRFSMSSGYYAGRGVNRGDLNADILEAIFKGIKRDHGEEASTNFVRFVNKLTDLSASAFIVAFERFWGSDCQEINVAQEPGDRTRLDAYGPALETQAFAVIAGALGGHSQSEAEVQMASESLKAEFVNRHLELIPEDERPSEDHRRHQFARHFG